MPTFTPESDVGTESSKMRLLYFGNEFPKDDLQDLFRKLRQHAKDRRHPVLSAFISEATLAIREEVRRLPAQSKALFPAFDNVLSLADDASLRKGPHCESVGGVLLCLLELATLITHHEVTSEPWDHHSGSTFLAGLGIGMLATAAVSLAPTLPDLPLAGAEVVRIAFRLGIVVGEVSENLEPRDEAGAFCDAWAAVVPGVSPEDAQVELDAIHDKEMIPAPSKVFISAMNQSSVTISGPPSRLKRILRTSPLFSGRKTVNLPVYGGLCHADHIYNEDHVRQVVDTEFMDRLDRLDHTARPGLPIFFTSTGRASVAKTSRGLFEDVITEILTQKIRWDDVAASIVKYATGMGALECQILVFRTSLPVFDVLDAFKSGATDCAVSAEELIPSIHRQDISPGAAPSGPKHSKIAIVGMSCRMPGGATDTEKFWDLLEAGLDVHRKIPADRFDVNSHYDPAGKRVNASHTPYGCFIDEPGLFDAPFFNMSPREAQQTDPMQRLALVTAYEALERAGYVANRTEATNLHRIGTFYGQASDDYREVNTAQEISTYFIPGGCRAFGPGRINYFFKFSGPSFSCDTACSSSLATIQIACTSLWNGDADTVVAGGMNVLTNSDAFAGLSHGHFLSKTPNACKTWDGEADGYCRADGIGSIVMKRLEDAEADNDNILGVILAAGTNHSAEAISITHPHAGAQSYLYRQVMASAGIDPLDVSFVEMHGTGTQAGDSVEIKSVSDVFAPATTRRRNARQPLYIGAVKSNVGHGEAVAGVTALLKVLLMYQKNAIPPHAGIKKSINPGFPKDLDKRNLNIPYTKQPWLLPPDGEKRRLAVVNNFSAAGGNTTILLEDAAPREVDSGFKDPRSTHAVCISAKSKKSLQGNLERLVAYLEKNPDVSLSDLSYSTTARRYHHNHRVAIATTSDMAQLRKNLDSSLAKVDTHKPIPATGPPTIAFAFTGQGASQKSMSLELYHDSPYFRSQILHLDDLGQKQGFPSFVPVIDGSYENNYAHSAVLTQMAQVAIQIALARYWVSLGVKPDVVVGHSLGEFAALHVAGVLSAADALFLVGERAKLLQEKCHAGSHQMLAVRASLEDIKAQAAGLPFEAACLNGPADTVLSGPRAQMEAVAKVLKEKAGYQCFTLDVAFAFHSSQTDPILDQYEAIAKTGALFRAPNLPIISPLFGKVIFDDKTVNASYMRRATREPVNFVGSLQAAQKISTVDEDTVWVEIGPHPVCVNLAKSTLPSVGAIVPSLRRGEDNWATMVQGLCTLHSAGIAVNWNEFHRPFEKGLRLLDLPTYAWNDKNYWIMYNGDWALTKGNTFYDAEKKKAKEDAAAANAILNSAALGPAITSTVQQIIEEEFNGVAAKVVMQSNLMQSDFLAAANGHRMNDCGVVTSSIHADIVYTLGEYLFKKLVPGSKPLPSDMNITNLEVFKGLVAQKSSKTPQLIRVSAVTDGILAGGDVRLEWHNVLADGTSDKPFATATLLFGRAVDWLSSWVPLTHLVQGRIDALERLAREGVANRFTHNMAYVLFAKNLVDYADKYRGMQSVVMHGLEAFTDVTLTTEKSGTWTVPPYFIDSVAHLAGFVMNVSDAIDTKANYCVTPGWSSMRFCKPLVAGAKYRSYVKMMPTVEDPAVYLGDVYVLQDDVIVGTVGAIKFRRYPRILLNRFFSPPDAATSHQGSKPSTQQHNVTTATTQKPEAAPPQTAEETPPFAVKPAPATTATEVSATTARPPQAVAKAPAARNDASAPATATAAAAASAAAAAATDDSVTARAMSLIAKETAIEPSELKDEANFSNLGVDSLMSLVIAEKFREELGVTVSGSLFLEYPTIGDLRSWLEEYYN